MKYLAFAFAGLLLIAGCISSTDPAGDAADDVVDESNYVTEPLNQTYSGTIDGAGAPFASVNTPESDSTQMIEVEPNATKVAINVTVDAPPQMQVSVGFDCEANDQGMVSCEDDEIATADSGVSWSTENATESFHIAFFWEAGAGEADWNAHVVQDVRKKV